MHADGQPSGQEHTNDDHHRRRGHAIRHWRWPSRRAMMSLPAYQRRALDRIEQTLVAEDPGLGLRFAIFTGLTLHEAMPATERVPHRLQRFVRRVIILPLTLTSMVALLVASGLISGRQACPWAQRRPHLACRGQAVPRAASLARLSSKTGCACTEPGRAAADSAPVRVAGRSGTFASWAGTGSPASASHATIGVRAGAAP
jgi:Protein of unknown function (DUF3040)